MKRYKATGKQVLEEGLHFADARNDTAAEQIAEAMNVRATTRENYLELHTASHKVTHSIRREGDEFACLCGMRWSVSEGENHP